MKSTFWQDFKAFSVKGNAIDMAVGVIIGSAFGKIVSSLVNDIIMPPLGWMIGGVDFKELSIELPALASHQEPVTIGYGNFIQTVFDFTIIALAIFFFIRLISNLKTDKKTDKKKESEAPATPAPPTQEELLTEIRDLLKKR